MVDYGRINVRLKCTFNLGPNIAENRCGLRKGKSTVRATFRIKFLVHSVVTRGRMALVVSLDIANAFNCIRWNMIYSSRSLCQLNLLGYLRNTIGAGERGIYPSCGEQ